ncbi:MAG: hypothetical protein FVQ80_11365 [Planctomycetes bacterium]|nr:hypothetical protein [Planctomycetota bacterium]
MKEEYCRMLRTIFGGNFDVSLVRQAKVKEVQNYSDSVVRNQLIMKIASAKKFDFTGLGNFIHSNLEKLGNPEGYRFYILSKRFWAEFTMDEAPCGLLCQTDKVDNTHIMSCLFFGFLDNVLTCLSLVQFTLDLRGYLVSMTAQAHDAFDNKEDAYQSFSIMIASLLNYLSNKGVDVEKRMVENKKKGKKGKALGDTYYILTVKTKRGRIVYEPSIIKNICKETIQREHDVVGHQRTYLPERPHVSGFVGVMNISEYTKGDKKLGRIFKNYYIKD